MPSVPVKVYRNNEIRRFRFEYARDGGLNLNHLVNEIQKLYPNFDLKIEKLAWKDTDGEFILMTSNDEVSEAIRNISTDNPILRIYLITNGENTNDQSPIIDNPPQDQQPMQTEDQEEEAESDATLHRHVICDGCEGEVRGIRYKCLTCPDFDLCSNCDAKHDQHPLIRIPSPHNHTWKPAFFAAQSVDGFFGGGHHHVFGRGRGHCRRGGHRRCPCAHKEEKQTKEGAGQQENKEQEEIPFFNEEVVRNLTEAFGSVLNAFGIQIADDQPAEKEPEKASGSASNDGNAHPDPKIAAALNYMLAMGYRNDGGWLTKLLEEKKGDVSAVLDILHPHNQQ